MTSVPKPLKFLRPFYAELEGVRATWSDELKSEKVSNQLPSAMATADLVSCFKGSS